jgi:hypothetical protein
MTFTNFVDTFIRIMGKNKKEINSAIRPMTDDERQASIQRQRANGG